MSIKQEKRINIMRALLKGVERSESDIASKTASRYGISKVSVHKYLNILCEEGIIARTGHGRYILLKEEILYDGAPRLTLIAGVNGVGKSSFSGVMQESDKYLLNIVDVDKITAEYKDEKRGAREAIKRVRDFLESGETFAEETTLGGRSILGTVKEARDRGYRIRLFYIGVDTEAECKRRIKNRVRNGGHNIPDADVERRFRSRRQALHRVLPFVDEAELYDNNNGFRKVAHLEAGEIAIEPHILTPPKWLLEIM